MDLYNEIARIAYELYEKNGYIPGRDLEHWVEAEKIVMARLAEEEKKKGGKKKEEKKKTENKTETKTKKTVTKKAVTKKTK